MSTTTAPPRALLPKIPDLQSAPTRRDWTRPAVLYLLGIFAVVSAVAASIDLLSGATEHSAAGTLKGALEVATHLVPGAAFILLGPLQFSARIRKRWPAWHRISGRVYVVSGVLAGGSAVWLSASTYAYGGWILASANLVFGSGLVLSIAMAMAAILRGDVPNHRAWMVRGFALGLVAGTSRLYVLPQWLVFGEPSPLSISLSMWAMWIIHLVVAEVFILRRRRR